MLVSDPWGKITSIPIAPIIAQYFAIVKISSRNLSRLMLGFRGPATFCEGCCFPGVPEEVGIPGNCRGIAPRRVGHTLASPPKTGSSSCSNVNPLESSARALRGES